MKTQRTLFAALLATFAIGTAQAQETTEAGPTTAPGNGGSEFFFQSAPGVSNVTVGADYLMSSVEDQGATDETETSGFALRAQYEYGLNQMFSVGANLRYGWLTEDGVGGAADEDSSGLYDPNLFIKGTLPMTMGRVRFGANLGLGFQDRELAGTEDGNLASGGFSLAPYVGYDMDLGPGVIGARASYQFNFEGTAKQNGTEADWKNGDVLGLSAFYEWMTADMLFGGALNWRTIGETEVNGTEVADSGYSPLGASIYARIPVSSFVVLPRLDYDFSAGGDAYDSYNDMTLSVAARFGF